MLSTQNLAQEDKIKLIALNMIKNMARFKYKNEVYQTHNVNFEALNLICIKVERDEEKNHIIKS